MMRGGRAYVWRKSPVRERVSACPWPQIERYATSAGAWLPSGVEALWICRHLEYHRLLKEWWQASPIGPRHRTRFSVSLAADVHVLLVFIGPAYTGGGPSQSSSADYEGHTHTPCRQKPP